MLHIKCYVVPSLSGQDGWTFDVVIVFISLVFFFFAFLWIMTASQPINTDAKKNLVNDIQPS